MMTFAQLLEHDPIASTWSAAMRAAYVDFSARLMRHEQLHITIGKGGLSYYKTTSDGPLFICHFNAKPQSKRDDLGFADLRFASLNGKIDLAAILADMRSASDPAIQIKINQRWCSFHFPLAEAWKVADLFVAYLLARLQ